MTNRSQDLTESQVIALNVSFDLGTDRDEDHKDFTAIDFWKYYQEQMEIEGIAVLKEWYAIPDIPDDQEDDEETWHRLNGVDQDRLIKAASEAQKLADSYNLASHEEKQQINDKLYKLLNW